MSNSVFNSQTLLEQDITPMSPISSSNIQSFASSVVSDMAIIEDILNSYILKLLNTIPENSTDIDGNNIAVDNSSTHATDNGIFYNTDASRPFTIKEMFLMFLKIIANIDNGLKEGQKVETIISANSSYAVNWPYADKYFYPMLYYVDSGLLKKVQESNTGINLYLDLSTSTLNIRNSSSNNIAIRGYIWHPTFLFS